MPKEKGKICPLLSIPSVQGGTAKSPAEALRECLEEDCAWYYVYRYPHIERVDKGCAVLLLPQVLNMTLRK